MCDRRRCPGFNANTGVEDHIPAKIGRYDFVIIGRDKDYVSEIPKDVNYFSAAIGVIHDFAAVGGDEDDISAFAQGVHYFLRLYSEVVFVRFSCILFHYLLWDVITLASSPEF